MEPGSNQPRPATLGALRVSGHVDGTVKEELRRNLLARLASGTPRFPSIVGFDESVIPALERGILAGHDVIFLGERGQAKTRLIRHLVNLLDEFVPVVAGCEVNDHPSRPICAWCRALLTERGERFIEFLQRVMLHAAPLAAPEHVAWFLASYARDAKARIQGVDGITRTLACPVVHL